jgi:hypothetical protein
MITMDDKHRPAATNVEHRTPAATVATRRLRVRGSQHQGSAVVNTMRVGWRGGACVVVSLIAPDASIEAPLQPL